MGGIRCELADNDTLSHPRRLARTGDALHWHVIFVAIDALLTRCWRVVSFTSNQTTWINTTKFKLTPRVFIFYSIFQTPPIQSMLESVTDSIQLACRIFLKCQSWSSTVLGFSPQSIVCCRDECDSVCDSIACQASACRIMYIVLLSPRRTSRGKESWKESYLYNMSRYFNENTLFEKPGLLPPVLNTVLWTWSPQLLSTPESGDKQEDNTLNRNKRTHRHILSSIDPRLSSRTIMTW